MTREAANAQRVSIRSRRDSDIPGAAKALVKVHESDGYPVEGVDEPEAWLTPPEVLQAWIAELDGHVVGHVALSHPNGEDAVSLWLDQSDTAESEVAVLARLFVAPKPGAWLLADASHRPPWSTPTNKGCDSCST